MLNVPCSNESLRINIMLNVSCSSESLRINIMLNVPCSSDVLCLHTDASGLRVGAVLNVVQMKNYMMPSFF